MKNIQGTDEELQLYHKNGRLAYWFRKDSDGISQECTYDTNGNQCTYKGSDGYSAKRTYDKNGNRLTFKDSKGESIAL